MPCTVWCDRAPFSVEQSMARTLKSLEDARDRGIAFLMFNRAIDSREVLLNVSRISCVEEQRDPTASWPKRSAR